MNSTANLPRHSATAPLLSASILLLALLSLAPAAGAQQPRIDIGVAADGGTLPDRLATGCQGAGSTTSGAGGQLSARLRPRRLLVLQIDTRFVIASFGESGCVRAGRETRRGAQASPSGSFGVASLAAADVAVDDPDPPYAESLLRMGLETAVSNVYVRGMIGIGMTLTPNPSPIGALSLAVTHQRLFVEVERIAGTFIPLYGAAGKVRPTWITARIGVSVPIGGN